MRRNQSKIKIVFIGTGTDFWARAKGFGIILVSGGANSFSFQMSNNLGSLLIDGCRSGVRPYLSREVDTSVRTSQVFIQVVMDTEEGQMSCEVTWQSQLINDPERQQTKRFVVKICKMLQIKNCGCNSSIRVSCQKKLNNPSCKLIFHCASIKYKLYF